MTPWKNDSVGRSGRDQDLVLQWVRGNQGVQGHQLLLEDQGIQSCQVSQRNLGDLWIL